MSDSQLLRRALEFLLADMQGNARALTERDRKELERDVRALSSKWRERIGRRAAQNPTPKVGKS